MQEVVTNGRPIVGYAQPLSRLQVSWGAILAGAIAALASSLILWMLAMSIIWTAMGPSVGSVQRGLVAAWITGMVCTIAGAFVGGVVAGYLPGNPRRLITYAHGFLAWCTMFLVASAIQLAAFGGVARTMTNAAVSAATTAVQTTGAAVSGVAGGPANVANQARNLLTSLGYTQAEARQIVTTAQSEIQQALRGAQGAAPGQAAAQARGALDSLFGATALYTWMWFATWLAAGGASVLGASIVIKRVRLVPQREQAREEIERPAAMPLRPAHEAR